MREAAALTLPLLPRAREWLVASEAAVDLTVNDPVVQGGALRAHAADNA